MKTYFASDFHLGVPGKYSSQEREKQLVRWLDEISKDAQEIFLVGDLFDFWFEYKEVIPKGYTRFLGKLAELRDAGIPIQFFTGNHDMWMFRYFEDEFGIPIHRQPILREINGKTFLIGHGDGLGPGDYGYKVLKHIFANPFLQWMFARVHPNFGIGLARFWSGRSRSIHPPNAKFLGPDQEWLIVYLNAELERKPADFYLFGHRHLPIDHVLKNGKSRYINLGEWLHYNSYAVFDGENLELRFFENPQGQVFGQL
ncbi:MAG: UDP-2,3-diacylglucosamine diphosphatase [Haliscomenobacter sp.]|nr:UDP-2,3-diacylglucosamine diphosphatase [Haliscomenobacter sp.]MBK9491015.1 UDP-2,3-diacylglucosamine diphosphatase [Haliscomenobacter sp.]